MSLKAEIGIQTQVWLRNQASSIFFTAPSITIMKGKAFQLGFKTCRCNNYNMFQRERQNVTTICLPTPSLVLNSNTISSRTPPLFPKLGQPPQIKTAILHVQFQKPKSSENCVFISLQQAHLMAKDDLNWCETILSLYFSYSVRIFTSWWK